MARRPRVETPEFYHIFNRGVESRDVLLDNEDKKKFLKVVCETSKLYHFTILSHCLMNNHCHLLLEKQP
ncbi:MAG: hypothetical protein E3J96_03180 [Sulfurovum sp.]|nr:MAG: hypothetical protein E3J96_03180 [Sulfurovum sp.]